MFRRAKIGRISVIAERRVLRVCYLWLEHKWYFSSAKYLSFHHFFYIAERGNADLESSGWFIVSYTGGEAEYWEHPWPIHICAAVERLKFCPERDKCGPSRL